ncbi:hypothetical protein MML48_1g17595 [Holotrichia oblita]|uniref:Uncharacterized protein n=1 Tax=Holotrichia oblita TaxID=644536 RepID=A0ACB9TZC8_HOLOL|nr:hypothetical protein MML48_1g17595 [Holotrichia oblita]
MLPTQIKLSDTKPTSASVEMKEMLKGNFKTEMSIQLKSNSKPYIQSVPRKVPIPLLPKLKDELDRLIKLEIIKPIDTHTEWVASILYYYNKRAIKL